MERRDILGLLGYLESQSKAVWLSQGLFETIQADLVKKETPELRRLWDFLRRSDKVNFFPEGEEIKPYSEESKKYEKVFDEWLISSISFAGEKGFTFVTNDLRLSQYLQLDTISSVNIFPFIHSLREKGDVDKISYSRILGDLAERFYVFTPFDAEDLFNIVMEDKGKITPRSYHLVMQIDKEGSVQASFFPVFTAFIGKIWRSGIESEDKIEWFSFITKAILIRIKPVFDLDAIPDESVQKQAEEAAANLGAFNKLVAKEATGQEKKSILEKLESIYSESKYFSILKNSVQALFEKSEAGSSV